MVKKSHTNQSLLIALDLWKVNYQTWLIMYLKFTKNNVINARKETESNQNTILLGLKIID